MFKLILTPYFTWLIIFFVLPTLILWTTSFRLIWRYRKVFIYTISLALIAGVLMDYYAIATKTWGWSSQCCSLPRVSGLPLEEIFFGIFSAVFITSSTIVAREVFLN